MIALSTKARAKKPRQNNLPGLHRASELMLMERREDSEDHVSILLDCLSKGKGTTR